MYMPNYNFNQYQYDQIKQGNDGFEDAYRLWYKNNTNDDHEEKRHKDKPKKRKEESSHAASRTSNFAWILWEIIVNVSFWAYTFFVVAISLELEDLNDIYV